MVGIIRIYRRKRSGYKSVAKELAKKTSSIFKYLSFLGIGIFQIKTNNEAKRKKQKYKRKKKSSSETQCER